jgi:single-strand DNA-binding protein
MAIHLNKATIIGYLAADPEAKGQNGIVTMRVGTSEQWKDKQTGEKRSKTQWHTVVIFNEHVANFVKSYAKKGDLVCVEGAIETRKWDRSADNLEDKYYTEIIVKQYNGNVQILSSDSKPAQDYDPAPKREPAPRKPEPAQNFTRDIDDEIPF